ncbi:hypothetical protein ACJIZ3_024061 [Penstemon smallii]|uniref:Uncharacterized protein n=1 Tax=Penstemon smallii TaxID=265156 RepID=A0ABD3TT58_9LAMI
MAQELDDGEFWLPSEFLTDDDLLADFKTTKNRVNDFSYGFNSDLGSPVESFMGSAETESEEDDFINGLTRKVSNSNFSSDYTPKGWKLSGSPQSTLCGCKPGSSRGSPNGVSRVSSPTEAKEKVGLDLLYAAAGEIARMRLIEEKAAYYSSKVYFPAPNPNPNRVSGFYPTETQSRLSYHQLQAKQFQQMKQQQMMKSGVWEQGKTGYRFENGMRTTDSSMAANWPTLKQSQPQQQQTGSGMRAVFLGETGAKKERTGTGVFIPRRFGTDPPDTRKKPAGCSVLLPDRVVHALNLNLDSVDSQTQPRINPNFTPEYDAVMKHRNNLMMAQQRRNLRQQQHPVMNHHHQELLLPQDWTY